MILAFSPFYFFRFWIIFTIIIQNSFSGSLHISSLFIWTYMFLDCSFICTLFLFLIIYLFILNLFCLRPPFPRLWCWILSSFWFLPPSGWSSGLCKFQVGFDLCLCSCWRRWVFSPLMGMAEWGGNPVCWWLSLYFCLVCCLTEASCTGCYWQLGGARSFTQIVAFVSVLNIWYSLGLGVLW